MGRRKRTGKKVSGRKRLVVWNGKRDKGGQSLMERIVSREQNKCKKEENN